MTRFFDFFIAFFAISFMFPLLVVIMLICFFDTGSPIFVQKRLGLNKRVFMLLKFRTMRIDTISTASHLVSKKNITKLGFLLRKAKLDELPQLFNVLYGDMSLVGPRPNLPNQLELIYERDILGVYSELPGMTGLAQIKNIDMSTPVLLAKTDKEMIDNFNLKNYFKYIIMTITGSGTGDAVKTK